MVSALAPVQVVVIWMVGKSTCGSGATGRNGNETMPTKANAAISKRRRDRPPDKRFRDAHDGFPCAAAAAGVVMVTGALVCSLY